RLVRDLLMYKRTERYIRQNMTVTQQDSVKRILSDKQFQNAERLKGLRYLVEELLGQAKLIVEGRDVEIAGSDAQSRIVRGFHDLLARTYPNLRMLRGVTYSENDIAACLRPPATLYGDDAAMISEAEQEMATLVGGNNRSGLRTSMLSLVHRFEHKPYGWYLAAIQCTLAKLIARGKIEARLDGNLLEREDELVRALRNTHGFANLLLDPQIEFTAAQVRWLKEFHSEFFDEPPLANEARALGQETGRAFQSLLDEMTELSRLSSPYPFLSALAEPLEQLRPLCGKPYASYLTELHQHEVALLDLKEKTLDPIRHFMSGPQKQIYDDAVQFLNDQEANFSYIEGDAADRLRAALAGPQAYTGTTMRQVKTLMDELQLQVQNKVKQVRAAAIARLDERWAQLAAEAEFDALEEDQQAQLRRPFEELRREVERQALIAVIRDSLNRFDSETYPRLLSQMNALAHPTTEETGADEDARAVRDGRIIYVTRSSLQVSFAKATLTDADDVEAYLEALRTALLQAIHEGKRVQL
ncbi:MAG: BREX system P-loop protein BrxC, partial [Ardenticatenaceae bacterium]